MAQAGYTPIQLYYSTTASAAPTAGNLANGELGINIADGKLYYKDDLGVVQLIASKASATGTVSSVAQSFTGGLISVSGSPITTSGTLALTVAGTSGGIPYFSSGTTWASSNALAANALMVGGGAGAAPATITTGTGVVTALGVNTGSAGAFVVNGGALGTPSSGTVTNLTGTASININGTVGATSQNTGYFTVVRLYGSSSGYVGLQGAAAAGSTTYTLPSSDGTNGQVLTTNGSATLTWTTAATSVTISNDTSTSSDVYPAFMGATTGTASTIYTGNANLLYKPSTGELKSQVPVAINGIVVNNATVNTSYTIAAGYNGMSAGPVTVASGVSVTVSSGSVWTVV